MSPKRSRTTRIDFLNSRTPHLRHVRSPRRHGHAVARAAKIPLSTSQKPSLITPVLKSEDRHLALRFFSFRPSNHEVGTDRCRSSKLHGNVRRGLESSIRHVGFLRFRVLSRLPCPVERIFRQPLAGFGPHSPLLSRAHDVLVLCICPPFYLLHVKCITTLNISEIVHVF